MRVVLVLDPLSLRERSVNAIYCFCRHCHTHKRSLTGFISPKFIIKIEWEGGNTCSFFFSLCVCCFCYLMQSDQPSARLYEY